MRVRRNPVLNYKLQGVLMDLASTAETQNALQTLYPVKIGHNRFVISNAPKTLGSCSTYNGVSNKLNREERAHTLYLLVAHIVSRSGRVWYFSDERYGCNAIIFEVPIVFILVNLRTWMNDNNIENSSCQNGVGTERNRIKVSHDLPLHMTCSKADSLPPNFDFVSILGCFT